MTSFNERSIRNPCACHVLVHVINIKPSSTPGLYAHTVSPLSALSIFKSPIWISSCSFPVCYNLVFMAIIPDIVCKQFLLHVAIMKRAPWRHLSVQFWHFYVFRAWLLMLKSLRCWITSRSCFCFRFKHLTFNWNPFCICAWRCLFTLNRSRRLPVPCTSSLATRLTCFRFLSGRQRFIWNESLLL